MGRFSFVVIGNLARKGEGGSSRTKVTAYGAALHTLKLKYLSKANINIWVPPFSLLSLWKQTKYKGKNFPTVSPTPSPWSKSSYLHVYECSTPWSWQWWRSPAGWDGTRVLCFGSGLKAPSSSISPSLLILEAGQRAGHLKKEKREEEKGTSLFALVFLLHPTPKKREREITSRKGRSKKAERGENAERRKREKSSSSLWF